MFWDRAFNWLAMVPITLIELENLGIRSKIYQMLSTPVRYMDEFASCCLTKQRIHYAIEIMQDYRSTWRYEFNIKRVYLSLG